MFQLRMLSAAAMSFACVCSSTIGEPITYQGSLNDKGGPANGAYDLRFRLVDSLGSQLTNPINLDNVMVEDGLFSVQLDFGDGSFEISDSMHLSVLVRDGDSTGTYTELLPWTTITPVPVATHALNSEFNRDGQTLLLGSSSETLLLNPEHSDGDPMNGATHFQVNTEGTGLGGMYINAPSGGIPFYAFAIDSVHEASINFDRFDDTINFLMSGSQTNAMKITTNTVEVRGDLIAGDDLIADNDVFVGDDLILGDDLIQDFGNETYRNATPVAFGHINSDGQIRSGSGNFSVSFNASTEIYTVDLPILFYQSVNHTVIITPVGSSPIVASSDSLNSNMLVFLHNLLGERVSGSFSFVVYSNAPSAVQTP